MSDFPRWPEWAPAIESVEHLGGSTRGVGGIFRLTIKGAPTGDWMITEYDEGRSFAWVTQGMGMSCSAHHTIEPEEGGSRVTLRAESIGRLAILLSPLIMRVAKRNVTGEAEGLKRRSEERSATPADG
jgi:hypothetical protein